ncbi:MAG: 50S ribosomal protein L6 [Candidatus Harrisonbacteria bacterium RIFCSPLOWO2_02_FULL_41_11]|uniref:Large ribosomal subunit protein uL6 n=1 Tax=Candidatus Harrisonbacteria bacterium RIFCSPHIGHO2_02_FULL_42_16 TaxID=1798404 RepID=A0A1G1ZIW1_9BACT|nr:MAG: 50S ribosomal protein L6 [Candidatus Harrisonbacteria bacterium RIFCSPHIGHO2_02_FULL_42_16]OGY67652.1 MAG: 50S ribosomal protein L6 [Candidatus Harrisonbacteria bacterium RIFCSPLOWO2_02_FULL_41_11]
MSKIGKKPIKIPSEVTVKIGAGIIEVHGKGGVLKVPILSFVNPNLKDGVLTFNIEKDVKQANANWGTMRALVQNAIVGVQEGFLKELLIQGVGYRAVLEGNTLLLNVGFSHPIKFKIPEDIKISVDKNTIIKVSGINKNQVGQVAANIRTIKKPEPYKGKGIRYKDEIVVKKAGKKAVGTES